MVSAVRAQQILFTTKGLNNTSWLCHRITSSAPTPTITELTHQLAIDAASPMKKSIAGAPYKSLPIGFTLNVEENAGLDVSFHNEDYHNAGAKIVSRNTAYASNIILQVRQSNQEVR
ncbi:unnamed protein product [Rotaria sordida]|uniref:Alanine dehydrogenase/pyridine nucleotide transhydrogenase N-terminal domain-containing protein n=1 Tax=Rotaria sordida TaxID=392033 RepID=A0A813V7H6_9BILA|nr:unnamed protein product [Rotaria sordida]CAF0838584.1 unnamed protein product [Rotaria sordida]